MHACGPSSAIPGRGVGAIWSVRYLFDATLIPTSPKVRSQTSHSDFSFWSADPLPPGRLSQSSGHTLPPEPSQTASVDGRRCSDWNFFPGAPALHHPRCVMLKMGAAAAVAVRIFFRCSGITPPAACYSDTTENHIFRSRWYLNKYAQRPFPCADHLETNPGRGLGVWQRFATEL
jgi:hypothetical protein